VRRFPALIVAAVAVASCGESGPTEIRAPARHSLASPAFEGGERIPTAYACDGAEVSPPLRWEAQGEEFVLTMTDPDADGFVHWVVYAIPGHVDELEEGRLPAGAVEGVNDTDEVRAVTSDLGEGASLEEVLVPIECCVASTGTLTATYGR
jgi:phosphatidylethanolamine-binding protein (PEBP) family uncharacterized protein